MNDVSPERSASEIRRDLRQRRSELKENLNILFRGRNPGSMPRGAIEPVGFHLNGARMPALVIAAGAVVAGFYLLRRRLWPLRFAGRFAELAAPVLVPILVRRIAGRGPGN